MLVTVSLEDHETRSGNQERQVGVGEHVLHTSSNFSSAGMCANLTSAVRGAEYLF